MSTILMDLKTTLVGCLGSVTGPEYNELKYLSDLDKNAFGNGKTCRYGIKPGFTTELEPGVVKALTYQQTFEFVLTKGFCGQSGVSDEGAYKSFCDLHQIALEFEKKLVNTKAGLPSRVLNVVNMTIDEPEFLQEKVTVLKGTFDVIYRLTLI